MTSPSRPSPAWTPATAAEPAALGASLLTPAFVRILMLQFAFSFAFSVYFLLPKYLATELHAEAATIGAASSAALLAGVLASPLVGHGLDRWGRRPFFLLGSAVTLLASLGMTTVHEVGPWLYFLRLVQGVGFSALFNAAAAGIADLSPPSRLGQAMGLLGVASLFTNAAAPALAEPIAHAWGWKPVFYGAAFMSAVSGLLAFSWVETAREPPKSVGANPETQSWSLSLVACFTGAVFGTLFTFTQPFALDLGAERVSGFFIGFTLAALVVRLCFGNLADRVGRRRVAEWALAGYGVVTLATAWLRPELLALYGFAFGLGHGFLFPSLAALVAETSDPERRGRALTRFNAAFNLGAGASMLGCGMLAREFGYAPVFISIGSLGLLSVLLLRVRSPRAASSPAAPTPH